MKETFTKAEALYKLKESLSIRLGQALEAMTGATQRCLLLPDLNSVPEDEDQFGWSAKYSGGANVQLRIFASTEAWRLIGRTVLEAAGVDEFDDPTLQSTYTETMAQAASSWAPDLSGLAGEKWESDGSANGAQTDSAAETWGYRFPMGDGEARIAVQISQELLTALLEVPALPPPPSVQQSATTITESTLGASQFDLLLDVELPVSVSFGRALVPLKEVLKLSSGSIVELNRAVTEPVEVIVNNCVIARGEVVVVEGNYGVRIQQIVSRQDRLRSVN